MREFTWYPSPVVDGDGAGVVSQARTVLLVRTARRVGLTCGCREPHLCRSASDRRLPSHACSVMGTDHVSCFVFLLSIQIPAWLRLSRGLAAWKDADIHLLDHRPAHTPPVRLSR